MPKPEEIIAKDRRPQGKLWPSISISIFTAADLERFTSSATLRVCFKASFTGIMEDKIGIKTPSPMAKATALPVGTTEICTPIALYS